MGDQNQTLYEDSDIGPDEYWRPAPEAIPLDDTRRFGEGIAAFSSRLTVRSAQRIVGVPDMESHRYIYLFDQGSIGSVIPSYARDIRAHWPDAILSGREVWVIASRHNLYARRPQNWRPISLVDYHPAYRSGVGKKPASLCAALRKASGLFDAGGPLKEVMQLLSEASVQLLRLVEFRAASGGLPNASNLWRQLGEDGSNRHLTLRKLLFDSILAGRGAWTDATWTAFLTELSTIFGFALPVNDNEGRLAQFLQFIALGGEAENAAQGGSRSVALVDGLSLKLGSIHSVKGKTVDAVLVVETEIHREQNQRVMDLATVLPHAFGLVQRDFAQNPVELAAATNIFVGVTRPRHLLGLALRRSECSRELEVAAQNRGWIIRDLTVQPWEHEAA
jgi:hypothetical protein